MLHPEHFLLREGKIIRNMSTLLQVPYTVSLNQVQNTTVAIGDVVFSPSLVPSALLSALPANFVTQVMPLKRLLQEACFKFTWLLCITYLYDFMAYLHRNLQSEIPVEQITLVEHISYCCLLPSYQK
jgi:hypothetical protein